MTRPDNPDLLEQIHLRVADRVIDEAFRERREALARERNPINQTGRALYGVWRSIITGGRE